MNIRGKISNVSRFPQFFNIIVQYVIFYTNVFMYSSKYILSLTKTVKPQSETCVRMSEFFDVSSRGDVGSDNFMAGP